MHGIWASLISDSFSLESEIWIQPAQCQEFSLIWQLQFAHFVRFNDSPAPVNSGSECPWNEIKFVAVFLNCKETPKCEATVMFCTLRITGFLVRHHGVFPVCWYLAIV